MHDASSSASSFSHDSSSVLFTERGPENSLSQWVQRNCGESLRSRLKAPSRNRPTTKWNECPAILDTASFIGRCIDKFGSGAL